MERVHRATWTAEEKGQILWLVTTLRQDDVARYAEQVASGLS